MAGRKQRASCCKWFAFLDLQTLSHYNGSMRVTLALIILGVSISLFSGVLVLPVDGIIQPVVASYIVDNLQHLDPGETDLVILELDTPGGLGTSMKEITTAIMNAPVPVVVYVTPSGAHAASAGFFILMASDIAAMAPSTTTGAAHPVNLAGGNSKDSVMLEKATNDFAASIRTMAQIHGRNIDLAEKAVREAVSFTETEAYDHNLIEVVARNRNDLLSQINGMEITRPEGEKVTIRTEGIPVSEKTMSFISRFLSVIVHPNVALILMGLGMLGLYVEFTHPGVIFPGVAGAICIILGLYALSVLPVDYTGLALIVLAAIMFILEVKVISYGMLTVGGIVSFVVGSMMLFDSSIPAFRVSLTLVIFMAVTFAAVIIFLGSLVLRAHKRRPVTGSEGIIGERGKVVEPLNPRGKVFIHGEYWNAISATPLEAGIEIEVFAADGMVLSVRPIHSQGGAV